ncbi:MAG: sigma-70 family RNA polymerase sigma factor [Deltaproteobacteria bacterium]|nr:sigma-70 family RNA polymerase sigma factor [Deltaproteobacteria bacterium]
MSELGEMTELESSSLLLEPTGTASKASSEAKSARVASLYRQHRDQVYRLALRYGRGDRTWAEDITQDVFVSLCKVVDRLDDDEALKGWFYRVATNRCLSRLRRETVANAPAVRWLLGRAARLPPDPETLTTERRDLQRVNEMLSTLPPKQRIAFCMYRLDGKEQADIGEILGFSKSYVCKLIKRAEASIRAAGWEVGDE